MSNVIVNSMHLKLFIPDTVRRYLILDVQITCMHGPPCLSDERAYLAPPICLFGPPGNCNIALRPYNYSALSFSTKSTLLPTVASCLAKL
jgi:hypothetical protein